ncbi:MAG: type VI secretion system accessory protein TagJ [Gammaproteobacteria bacterium]
MSANTLLAEQSLREGDLRGALTQLQTLVRNDPSNASYRVFLFQLLAVTGDWERALTQLNVAADLDGKALAMAQTYREALRCEALRAEIFAGQHTPLVFGDPEHWVALMIQAQHLTAQARYAQAQTLREEAFELAPTTRGVVEDQPFEWIADADPRLGPMLEAIVNGRYYWVPFHRIRSLRIEAPADLRDVVWTPAQFTWVNGGETVGLIPTRYPDSHLSEDDAVRLARKTDWRTPFADLSIGIGQRMLATDAGEYALMDIRHIELETPANDG